MLMLEQLLLGCVVYVISYNYFYYSNSLTDIRNAYDHVTRQISSLQRAAAKIRWARSRYFSVKNFTVLFGVLLLVYHFTDTVGGRLVSGVYGALVVVSLIMRFGMDLLDNLVKNLCFYKDTVVIHLLTLLDDNFKAELRKWYISSRENALNELTSSIKDASVNISNQEQLLIILNKCATALETGVNRLKRIQLCKNCFLSYKRYLLGSRKDHIIFDHPARQEFSKKENLGTMSDSLALTSRSCPQQHIKKSMLNRALSDLNVSFESDIAYKPEVCVCVGRLTKQVHGILLTRSYSQNSLQPFPDLL